MYVPGFVHVSFFPFTTSEIAAVGAESLYSVKDVALLTAESA